MTAIASQPIAGELGPTLDLPPVYSSSTSIRRQPYTATGVKRLYCHHCKTAKAETAVSYKDPADRSQYPAYFALCCEHGLEITNLNRAFFHIAPLVLTDD